MKSSVSIILLNYNWKQFNKECIDSILLQSYKNFEIIFVDNASTDWSLEEVEKLYEKEINDKKIIIVKNKTNTWFTGWNNLWVKYASKDSDYICLLNNDTTVEINWLKELVNWIESDPRLWAVGSMILDKWYEEEIKNMYLKKHETYVLTVLWETAKKKVSEEEIKKLIYYTSSLSWCCFLYRKNIINTPFPERYFAYWEDVFLSIFLLIKWYRLGVCLKSVLNHFGSWSFWKKPSNSKLFYWNRNQIINFLVFYWWKTKLILLPLFFLTQVAHIFINNLPQRFNAKLKSWIRIWKERDKILELRAYVDREKKINDKMLIWTLSSKFSDDLYWMGTTKTKKNIIRCINGLFKWYVCLFFGK